MFEQVRFNKAGSDFNNETITLKMNIPAV